MTLVHVCSVAVVGCNKLRGMLLSVVIEAVVCDRLTPDKRVLIDWDSRGLQEAMVVGMTTMATALTFFEGA